MSWSVSSGKPVKKEEINTAIEAASDGASHEAHVDDQIRTAKNAAKLIAREMNGPYLVVSLSGHANGVGDKKKEGMANDCVNVSVTQVTEEDLQNYK